MSTEVWFRNPERYMPLVVDAGATRVLWHRGRLLKRRVDPLAHARMFWPAGLDWRVMVVDVRGALLYDPSCRRLDRPSAVFPVWHYGEALEGLETLLESNIASLGKSFDDDPLFTPKPNQEHRVLISGWPELSTNMGKKFMALMGELQADYPEAKMHLFEAISYRTAFGFGLRAADLDPATTARFKKVYLANGREAKLDALKAGSLQWFTLHGYSPADLGTVEARISFNIRSALWAGENYDKKVRFRTASHELSPEDIDSPNYARLQTNSFKTNPSIGTVAGDKVACDSCSLVDSCKYSRAGSVCTLPESETAGLARFFKTRDTDTIIDGLSAILQTQAQRAELGMHNEQLTGELDSETSAVLRTMFEGGVKLAKLINPALAPSGPKIAVQINQGSGAQQVSAANPKALMAALVRELEERGVPREDITPEMVMNLVQPKEVLEINP